LQLQNKSALGVEQWFPTGVPFAIPRGAAS